MSKILFVLVLIFVADSLSQIILPTWHRPPTSGPIIRTARDVSEEQPLWLFREDNIDRAPATEDHPYLPKVIDDIKLDPIRRYARSVDSPSARRSSGSRSSSGSRDTGPTHPGYNRRNARSAPTSGIVFKYPRDSPFVPHPEPSPTIPVKPFKTHA